jgi:hypothetical protein
VRRFTFDEHFEATRAGVKKGTAFKREDVAKLYEYAVAEYDKALKNPGPKKAAFLAKRAAAHDGRASSTAGTEYEAAENDHEDSKDEYGHGSDADKQDSAADKSKKDRRSR